MKVAFQPGRRVVVKDTAGSLSYPGEIIRYDLEGFYRVRVEEQNGKRELVVHEDDMELAPPNDP